MSKKIKIAFIKCGGLSAGGSEKLLQIIAAYLPKDRFEVDFFASDPSPVLGAKVNQLSTSPERVRFLQDHGVKIIKFKMDARDIRTYTHDWVNTDFWQLFDEKNYDLIQTCRSGHKEYPFYKIRNTPILDIIALSAGVDNQYNIARVMHLNKWSAESWVKKGGDSLRVVTISLPIWVPEKNFGNYRQEMDLNEQFVFGFHQRVDDNIFSPLPLMAYKQVETENSAFLILGGGDKYKQQAKALGLKNISFFPSTGDQELIYKFLNTLNVFAHGRKDGEVNSQAMAEAMYFGLPIISHFSEINNGHVECIADAGRAVNSVENYAREMRRLMDDRVYYIQKSAAAKKRFAEKYELYGQIKHVVDIYNEVIKNPFPHKLRRRFYALHYTQNVRIWLAQIYLFLKYRLGLKFLKKG